MSKGQKPIVFLGKKLSRKAYPSLYEWAKKHPESLKKSLLKLAKLPGGNLANAMQNLESDLQHDF